MRLINILLGMDSNLSCQTNCQYCHAINAITSELDIDIYIGYFFIQINNIKL